MKKLLSISLTVLLAALLIVSCSPEQKAEDGLALVSFSADERTTRSLTRTNPQLNADDLYWSYTASKTDSTGLTTGTETTPKAVKADKGLSAVGPFSYGDWSFTLYGYADEARSELAYKGTSEITISKTENTLAVTVESQSSGKNGYLEFPAKGTIALTGTSVAPDYSKYVEKIYIKNLDDNTETTAYDKAADTGKTTRTFTLKAGSYAVTVSYLNKQDTDGATDVIVYATDTIYVTIADYLTTKIAGDISENTGDVEFEVKTGEVKVTTSPVTIESNKVTTIKVEAAPVSEDKTSTEENAQNTTISIPSGALDSETVTATTVKATTTSYTREAAASTKPSFTIVEETSGTSTTTEAVVLGGLDIDLYVNDSTEKTTDFSEEGKALTITTYIAKGLNKDNIVVKYDGPANADGTAKSDGTVTDYDSTTGKLTFTVNHLSSYYFVSKTATVFNSTKQFAYDSLEDAVNGADSGDKLALMKDITVDRTIDVKKSFSLDLGGKTITAATRVFLIHGGAVSIDNGTIEATVSPNNGSVIRVSCSDNCTDATEAISLTVGSNATIKGTTSYGVTAFGNRNATVNVYGKIESANAALAGNGSTKAGYEGKFILNVYEGASLTANGDAATYADAVGIYQPDGDTVLNIYGGTVTSQSFSAVEIRAGKANISGGKFETKASSYESNSNQSGPTTKGAALAVALHVDNDNSKNGIAVEVSGGEFTGLKQLAVVNPEARVTDDIKNVKVVVSGGVSFEKAAGYEISGTYYVDKDAAAANGIDVTKSIWNGASCSWESDYTANSEQGFIKTDFLTSYVDPVCVANAKMFIADFESKFVDTGKIQLITDGEKKNENGRKIAEVTVLSADALASIELLQKYFSAKCIVLGNENNYLYNDYYYWAVADMAAEIAVDVDINLNGSNYNWTPVICEYPVDFKEHTVSNLKCENAESKGVGLFNTVYGVSNLVIENATVSGKECVGIVTGSSTGFIKNVKVKSSSVTGSKYVGGIIGHSYASITDCNVEETTVTGSGDSSYQVGGIVGFQCQGTVSGCSVNNSAVSTVKKEAGGIAGRAYIQSEKTGIVIENNIVTNTTVAVGEVKATAFIGSDSSYAGLICGGNYLNCSAGTNTYEGKPNTDDKYKEVVCKISGNTVDGVKY